MNLLLTPELLRRPEQFQLLAARRVELVATPTLTPALSPRRGRIARRRPAQSHVQLARTPLWSDNQKPEPASATCESPHASQRRSLSPGVKMRENVTQTVFQHRIKARE